MDHHSSSRHILVFYLNVDLKSGHFLSVIELIPDIIVFCCTTNEYSHLQRSPMSFIETLLQLRSISRMKCTVIWMGYYFPVLEKIKKLKSTVARFLVWQPVLNTAPTSQLGGGRHCFWGCITPIYRTELMF